MIACGHERRLRAGAAFLAAACLALAGAPALAGGKAPAKPPGKPPPPIAGTVAGTATDEAGKPLEGAQVLVAREKPPGTWKGTSDAKGRYFVKGVPPGPVSVNVRSRGRIPVQKEVTVLAGGSVTVDAKLEPGVRFAGKVTDMQMRPVAGARIVAYRSSTDEDGFFGSFSWFGIGGSGRSGDDGAFEVDGLAPGQTYKLRVSHPHHLMIDLPGLPAQAGGGHDTLDVTLEDAAWATGVVVDAAGKPVAGAHVTGPQEPISQVGGLGGFFMSLFMSDGEDTTSTDAQGRFEVGGLKDEGAQIEVVADGFFDGSLEVSGLEAGKEKPGLRIALEPATAWIEGIVVDEQGKPIAGAGVIANGDLGHAGAGTSDAQGRFRIERLKSKSEVRVEASADGRLSAEVEKVALNTKDVRITLKPAPRLKVRILGADGKPLKAVSLVIRTKGEDGRSQTSRSYEQSETGLDVPLWEGEVEVDASAEGYESHPLGEWTLAAGGSEDAGTVTLTKAPDKPKDAPMDGSEEDGSEDD